VDIAENMIEVARHKLSAFSDITYEVADLSRYAFGETFDVALSSLALHHLETDHDKREFYGKVFAALNPGGAFYNADNVSGQNETITWNYLAHWKQFMRKTVSEEEIEGKWMKTHKDEDRPAKLINQLDWLREIGFEDVDVIWKYYNFSVYGGIRANPTSTLAF
jgi:tRNA (cmo5U34)-methyltransferase